MLHFHMLFLDGVYASNRGRLRRSEKAELERDKDGGGYHRRSTAGLGAYRTVVLAESIVIATGSTPGLPLPLRGLE